ncbi:MAG: YidC/Oxa1 family membrane protein insertase [Ruminococcaceae bacterium]|nr:YidC/Oxa1 family membrane protein insertase [Oscillospiraceae bacterium]
MKTKKITGRIAACALAILLLLTALVGCAGKQAVPTLPFDKDKFTMNSEEEFNAHGLKTNELTKVAEIFSAAYGAKEAFDARQALVAANRGYDMTAEGFTDTDASLFKEDKGLNLDYAKSVIKKANTTASAAGATAFTDAELTDVLDRLNAADVAMLLDAFRQTVNVEKGGFWDGLLGVIGKILNWITRYLGFGSYVVGICLFAIVIEILMLPFSIKQQKNSIKQATLRPKEMAIKNKYKGRNDQPTMQKMQTEIQELYQRENFSPFSGCLPLLVQLPIVMALYYIVIDPLHYVLGQGANVTAALTTFATASPAAGGLGMRLGSNRGTIELLSLLNGNGENIIDALGNFQYYAFSDDALASLDKAVEMIPNFNIGSLNFGLTPSWSNWILMLVPVLTFVTYFLSSKINRKFMYQPATNEGVDARQQACSNSMMDVTMPAMSTFFTMAVPAVIGIYWAFRSWVGLLKSFIMSRIMPLPTFTEEDYKAAEREMAGKTKKKINKTKSSDEVRAVRSLHYIDDEDFEDTRERGLARKAALEEKEKQEKAEAAERAQKLPFGKALLKKDDRKNESEEARAEEIPEKESPAEETPVEETKTDDTTNNE